LSGLARRYVQPLFEVALAKNSLDAVGADLNSISEALASSPELRGFLLMPSISRTTKIATLRTVFKDASPYTMNFLQVVVNKKRTEVLFEAGEMFEEMVSWERGVSHGTLESAVPIDDQTFTEIEKSISGQFGGKVKLARKVVPSLVGGIRLRVGNRVLDASVRGRLEQLKAELTGE
jgi:F-type H+-transporting ATPase subunit delta